jgi:NTP pyrophosphatase (non-canonical NTP hydrolase)
MHISTLQDWVRNDWAKNSSNTPSTELQLLYLMEEMGEVAEAIRKTNGAKERINKKVSIGSEMADLLVCLITLANTFNVDIEAEVTEFQQRMKKRHAEGY